jgi:hypothetical protein
MSDMIKLMMMQNGQGRMQPPPQQKNADDPQIWK